MKLRLDEAMAGRGLVSSRSQAKSYIKLSRVEINGKVVTKPGALVSEDDKIKLTAGNQYVSRAALKLESVAKPLRINFRDKTVLDVGSSTGGFTQYALGHGAKRIIAVEVGKDQLHSSLRGNPKIELHEQTDIRDFKTDEPVDIAVADVSFISLREILPSVAGLVKPGGEIIAMVKPQFEAKTSDLKHKGVIKNDRIRRDILSDFEAWAEQHFVIIAKSDSAVAGAKGNVERFYKLRSLY